MYNSRIKKSILFFIAAMITCAFYFGSGAQAATTTIDYFLSNSSAAMTCTYVYQPEQLEASNSTSLYVNDTALAVYEQTFYLSQYTGFLDGYLNGINYVTCQFTPEVMPNWTLYRIEVNYTPYDADTIFSGIGQNFDSISTRRVCVGYSDYTGFNGSVALGEFKVTATYKAVPDYNPVPGSVSCTTSITQVQNQAKLTLESLDIGAAGVIKNGILDALNTDLYGETPDKYSIIDMLSVYSQFLYSMDVRQEFINQNISTLVTDLVKVLSKQDNANSLLSSLLSALYDFHVTWNNYMDISVVPDLETIISKLETLINIGQTETEGASEAQAAVNELQSADAALRQPTLSDSDIFNPIDNAAAEYGGDAANIFWWTWDSRISLIITLVVSLGLVGFIIYGKSG